MITRSEPGVLLPVGTAFRFRQLSADDTRPDPLGFDRKIPWLVSWFEGAGGAVIEAWKYHALTSVVAFDIGSHSTMEDVLREARRSMGDPEGWVEKVVRECEVDGCSNPLTLHQSASPSRSGEDECPTCLLRTVVSCRYCGMPDPARYINREWMLANETCFGCWYWIDRATHDNLLVTPEFVVYSDGGNTKVGARGYGGHEWTVTYPDGRMVMKNNLWSGCEIPERMRDRFTPNVASVVA